MEAGDLVVLPAGYAPHLVAAHVSQRKARAVSTTGSRLTNGTRSRPCDSSRCVCQARHVIPRPWLIPGSRCRMSPSGCRIIGPPTRTRISTGKSTSDPCPGRNSPCPSGVQVPVVSLRRHAEDEYSYGIPLVHAGTLTKLPLSPPFRLREPY